MHHHSLDPNDPYCRYRYPAPTTDHHGRSMHWTNASEIATALRVNVWTLVANLSEEFENFRVFQETSPRTHKTKIRIIFPTIEPFLGAWLSDFCTHYRILEGFIETQGSPEILMPKTDEKR